MHLHVQFVTFEEDVFEDRTGLGVVVDLHKETEGERVVNVCLTHIEYFSVVTTKYLGD